MSKNYENEYIHFATVADFVEAAQSASGEYVEDTRTDPDDDWYGDSWQGAVDKALHGDTSAVGEARATIQDIAYDIDLQGLKTTWAPAPVGAYPIVPAYLANHPDSMARKVETCNKREPVTIWFSPSVSSGISAADAKRRSVAVLALVLAMQQVRPVKVKLYTARAQGNHTIDIRTDPMVLSEAAHMLTSVSVLRRLTFSVSGNYGFRGKWAKWFLDAKDNDAQVQAVIREKLGAAPDDIVIPPVHSGRGDWRHMVNQSAQWINSILDQYRQR
jgi:hypothetical protein